MKTKPEYNAVRKEFTVDKEDVDSFIQHGNLNGVQFHGAQEGVANGDYQDMILEVQGEITETEASELLKSFKPNS